MTAPVDGELLDEILRDVRTRLARLEGMRDEMREGFASLHAHSATRHADAAFLERRVVELERDVDRIKQRLALTDPSEAG